MVGGYFYYKVTTLLFTRTVCQGFVSGLKKLLAVWIFVLGLWTGDGGI